MVFIVLMRMRTYSLIIEDIQKLLNKKFVGRKPKGFNLQDEFLDLLQELKRDYQKELSTKFLFNLMDNENHTRQQKRQKIRNLLRGLEQKRINRYFRDLNVVSYRTEVKDFRYKKGYTSPRNHRNREVKTTIKETKKGFPYVFNLDNGIREMGEFIKEDTGIYFNIRCQTIAKEFLITEKETLKFIEL